MLRLNKLCFSIFILLGVFPVFSFQFGNGNNESTMTFIKVADDIKDVYLGWWSSYIIKNDNSLWGTGFEIYKTFGMEGPKIEKSFVKLQDDVVYYNGSYLVKKEGTTYITYKGITKVDYKVKKGNFSTVFIGTDNNLYVKGENTHGAFGLGSKYVNLTEPKQIMSNVIDVYSNGYYTQVVNSRHELYISGEHYLPAPYKESCTFFKLADNVRYSTEGFYITDNNELYAFGWCGYGASGLGDLGKQWKLLPTKVMDDVLTVECNQTVSLIIKTNGDLYGCGGNDLNYQGQLGFGNKEPVYTPKFIMKDVKKVSLGTCHVAVLKNDGTLWMCGANYWAGGY